MYRTMLFAIFIFIFWSAPASAEYIVTGQVSGEECTNYLLFQTCSFVDIHAVDKDGELYHLATAYDSVSNYDDANGLCWVYLNMFSPDFYTLIDGEYEMVDVEYLVFPCEKR